MNALVAASRHGQFSAIVAVFCAGGCGYSIADGHAFAAAVNGALVAINLALWQIVLWAERRVIVS